MIMLWQLGIFFSFLSCYAAVSVMRSTPSIPIVSIQTHCTAEESETVISCYNDFMWGNNLTVHAEEMPDIIEQDGWQQLLIGANKLSPETWSSVCHHMDYLKKCLLAVSKDCRNHRYRELYNNKTNGPWNAMAFKILAFACDHEETSYEMLKCLGNPMTTRNLMKYSNALSEYFRFYWTGPDHSFLESIQTMIMTMRATLDCMPDLPRTSRLPPLTEEEEAENSAQHPIRCPSGKLAAIDPFIRDVRRCTTLPHTTALVCPEGNICERLPIMIPGLQNFCCVIESQRDPSPNDHSSSIRPPPEKPNIDDLARKTLRMLYRS